MYDYGSLQMIKVLLDTNIYDRIYHDAACQKIVQELIQSKDLELLVSPKILAELRLSPFKGVPRLFPVTYVGESVAVAGGQVGDRCGKGDVLKKHLGTSRKLNDAFIADVASMDAAYLVTEDHRLKTRLNWVQSRCRAIDFNQFVYLLEMIKKT